MRKLSIFLFLFLVAGVAMGQGVLISDLDANGSDFAAGDLLELETSGGSSVKGTLSELWSEYFVDQLTDLIDASHFADADWGDGSVASGVFSLDIDIIDASHLGDADWGDVSVSSGSVTLDADVVAPAEMADADHGDFSYSSGVATLDADVVAAAEMADADHGDISWSGGVATVDSGAVLATEVTFTPQGDIAATDVDGALAELDSEKLAAADALAPTGSLADDAFIVGTSGSAAEYEIAADGPMCYDTGTNTLSACGGHADFPGGSLIADGTQCADAAKVTINSGPVMYTVICADNDGSSIYFDFVPEKWDAGTLTAELHYIQTAADTSALNADVTFQCRAAGETPSSTWGTEIAIDDAAVTGSNALDITTSAAATPAGTCADGDRVWGRIQLDATGTTTAVATLHLVGVVVHYSKVQ